MLSDYSIRLAHDAELSALPAIERAAAVMFRDSPHPQMADFPLASEHLDASDLVWIALDARQHPVGFAIVRPTATAIHLQELDVHPQHARRGLGARLIDAIAGWAAQRGAKHLTLSTCDDVPWNGPYYARLGFRVLSEHELTADLQNIRHVEAAAGLPMEHRICMMRVLDATGSGSPR